MLKEELKIVIGLRVLALIIDMAVCIGTWPLVMWGFGWVFDRSGGFAILLMPLIIIIFIAWPFLYLVIPTGLWGKTLGKFLCRLTVSDFSDNPPGFWRALGREVLKCVAVVSGIGTMLTMYQVFQQGETWYDHLCKTRVDFQPYVRLTKTQRDYRKYMKNR